MLSGASLSCALRESTNFGAYILLLVKKLDQLEAGTVTRSGLTGCMVGIAILPSAKTGGIGSVSSASGAIVDETEEAETLALDGAPPAAYVTVVIAAGRD